MMIETVKSKQTEALTTFDDELASYGLRIMWELRQRAARTFEPLGFRTNRVLVLEFIARGCTQPKDLHQALGVVPPAISTIVAELEARGLIKRQVDQHDGRRVNLSLTEEGIEVRQQLQYAWFEAHRELHDALSETEISRSHDIYRKVLGDMVR